MTDVAIVVPCYNEAERLDTEAFATAVSQHAGLHLIMVNDGSSDATQERIDQLARCPSRRIASVNLRQNVGKGEAVRHGLTVALDDGHQTIGYWDADLATPLCVLPRMSQLLDHDPRLDWALASRVRLLGHEIDRSPTRHITGRLFATFASLAIQLPVYDTQCGAKLFRAGDWLRHCIDRPFRNRWAFDVELISRYLCWCRQNNQPPRMQELPLQRWSDVGESHVRLFPACQAVFSLAGLAIQHRRGMRRNGIVA
ncbi:MAG: glycosyltransferase [Rhodopirellula sp. JB044]|uniref:glycosyltransferase n=1 Tax=Rhodopirellula sp. JB044 TaxID=3342844 RepID=UPI003709EF2A